MYSWGAGRGSENCERRRAVIRGHTMPTHLKMFSPSFSPYNKYCILYPLQPITYHMNDTQKKPNPSVTLNGAQKKQTGLIIAGAAVIVIGVLLLFLLPSGDIAKDGKITDREAQAIKAEIIKLINTPQEEPVMALVTNADQLITEQPFYQGVTNGDVLVIYPQARKAILFNPRTNKLVNVGPVNVGEPSQAGRPEPGTLAPAAPVTEGEDN